MSDRPLFQSALLIEDDSAHAHIIKRALKPHITEIVHAPTFAAGLDMLGQQSPPQIVLTDLNLPDASQLSHVETLCEHGSQAPVIVLTSSTSLDDAVSAMKLGAQDFIVKNFDDNFKESISLALSRLWVAVQIERERKRLEREMQALRLVIENGHDGVAVVNMNGEVIYANTSYQRFVEHCGGDPENLLHVFTERVKKHEIVLDNIREKIDTLSAGAVWHTEVLFHEHKELAYDMSFSVLERTESSPVQGKCAVWIRNISGLKRQENFQRELIATTTHDLKGPLGTISLCVELLQDLIEPQGKASEIVLRIDSITRNALNLIDGFLSARKIQEGNLVLTPQELDVVPVIAEAVTEYESVAAAKRIELSFEPKSAAVIVSVDRMALMRVIGNLVSNACKFTQKGGKVSVSAAELGGDLHLWVSDNGKGMEPAETRKIFDRFGRLKQHSQVAGTGLGLFIVKSLVAAHGGQIEVTSAVDVGTTFELIFPKTPPMNEHGELLSLDFG